MTPHEMDEPRDPRLEEALEALRGEFARSPEEHIAQRHLAAMRAAADAGAPASWWAGVRERGTLRRNPMPALTPRTSVIGAALAMAFVFGLAVAGSLPDAAQNLVSETVSKVGVDLPDPDDDGQAEDHSNQGQSESDENDDGDEGEKPDNHGRTVSSVAHDDSLEGCEHGQAVSAVASSKNQGNDDAPGLDDDHDPCDKTDETSDHDNSGKSDDHSGPGSSNSGQGGDDDDDDDASTPSSTPDDDDDDDDDDELGHSGDDNPGVSHRGGNSGSGGDDDES